MHARPGPAEQQQARHPTKASADTASETWVLVTRPNSPTVTPLNPELRLPRYEARSRRGGGVHRARWWDGGPRRTLVYGCADGGRGSACISEMIPKN